MCCRFVTRIPRKFLKFLRSQCANFPSTVSKICCSCDIIQYGILIFQWQLIPALDIIKLVKRLSNSSMAALNLTTLSSGSSKVVAKFLHSRVTQPLHAARLRLSSSDMFTSTKSLFPVKLMKSFPVRCSVRTNPSKVRSKHRTADLCPTCIKFPYVNINTAGIHSPLRPPSCPGTTPLGPRPQTHRPAKSKMTDHKWRTPYHCPSIPMSIHWRHKVNNDIMYTFKCLPGRSQACNPRPPQLPCTKSQPADTALPGLTKQWDTYHM